MPGIKMGTKRPRKVSFAVPVEANGNASKVDSGTEGEDARSLLADASNVTAVTAFDLSEELSQGDKLTAHDGIIPQHLAGLAGEDSGDDAGDSSSSAEHASPPTRGQAHDPWGDGSDSEGSGSAGSSDGSPSPKRTRAGAAAEPGLADAVGALLAELQPGETGGRLVRRAATEGGRAGVARATDVVQAAHAAWAGDAYSAARGELARAVGRWELRWAGGDSQGAFTAAEMEAWAGAGYFADAARAAQTRGEGGGTWLDAARVFPLERS